MIALDDVERYGSIGLLPGEIASRISERAGVLSDSIRRVERASGIRYPPSMVSPYLLILIYSNDVTYEVNVYARTLVKPSDAAGVEFNVEFTAPLVLYASRDSMDAIVAHELTHYLMLAKKFYSYSVTNEPITATIFEAGGLDMEMTIDPETIFRRRSKFLRLLKEKFQDGFKDEALERRVERRWLRRGLPVVRTKAEENVVRIPVENIARFSPDRNLVEKICAYDRR